jgi:CRISPR-associated exonuclease Cas4
MDYDEESLLPLSGIQHFAFCPRQWALIHIEQQWQENVPTVEGKHLHERVHSALPAEVRGDTLVARSLPLVSYRLGLFGVADVVEFTLVTGSAKTGGIQLYGREGLWRPRPVEYKRGRQKTDDRDEVQLCAQAICLEEMLNVKVETGCFFYGKTRRRLDVAFTDELRRRVEDLAQKMHEVFAEGVTPPASVSRNCKDCSLVDICLPNIRRKSDVDRYIAECIRASTGDAE